MQSKAMEMLDRLDKNPATIGHPKNDPQVHKTIGTELKVHKQNGPKWSKNDQKMIRITHPINPPPCLPHTCFVVLFDMEAMLRTMSFK